AVARFFEGGTATSRGRDGAGGEGGWVEGCWSDAGAEHGTSRQMIPPFPSGHRKRSPPRTGTAWIASRTINPTNPKEVARNLESCNMLTRENTTRCLRKTPV